MRMWTILLKLVIEVCNCAISGAEQPYQIVYINLDRRPEKQNVMESKIPDVFPNFTYYRLPAVDGLSLDEGTFEFVKMLPGYEDPYLKRPMKYGEVACLMSHRAVWLAAVERNWKLTLVLEDDANFLLSQFGHNNSTSLLLFHDYLNQLLDESLQYHGADLIYIGRKPMEPDIFCEDCSSLVVKPGYSYWTVAYFITYEGASKLLGADPLQHMVPVDEFLPFMYGQHPKLQEWLHLFPNSVEPLVALSASELLVEPQWFYGSEEFVSDTEDSQIIDTQNCLNDESACISNF